MLFDASLCDAEQFCERAGAEIACRADFERNAALDQDGHQLFVANRGDAVADAFRAENFNRVANRLGSGHFAGMSEAMKSFGGGIVVYFAEISSGKRFFVATQSKGNDAFRFHLCGEARNVHRLYRAELAHRVKNPLNAQTAPRRKSLPLDALPNHLKISLNILLF